ncbi:MAG: hypothetical protein KKA36_08990 [Gammaproteobacteria bacterium]|nr:hypothetical protein [Gammaproteobacteria bacterium]MBU2479212.1 hypothetical protein [Gammaproteobacteria bacterium]
MNSLKTKSIIATSCLCLALSGIAHAEILTFDFTGRLIVADYQNNIIINTIPRNGPGNNQQSFTPIAATLSYDTAIGVGSSSLSLVMDNPFFGAPATFHDISMTLQTGTNLITGQALVDWNSNNNMPLHIEWDATGLLNAINYGLKVGDKLSGTNLYRDADNNQIWEASEWVMDIGSATPYSDILQDDLLGLPYYSLQGPAPMAATSGSLGIYGGTGLDGIRGYFDIGSGNSMYVTSVSSVPVPAAAWLLGSGLLGLLGLCKRYRA